MQIECSNDRYIAHQTVEKYWRENDFKPISETRNYLWNLITQDGLSIAYIENNPARLSSNHDGAIVRFQVEAVPVKTFGKRDGRKKHFRPVRGTEDQIQWLTDRFSNNGLEVTSVIANEKTDRINPKKYSQFTTHYVEFAGEVKILDYQKANAFLLNGIGGQRIYGFGLIFLEV